jgi:hypothetical protein
MLDQMVLDAEVDAQGSVQFFLGTQSGGTPAAGAATS